MSQSPLIAIENISYSYATETKDSARSVMALHDVDLLINQGEYVVLLGHNGSGKSTLARHCNALLLPSTGRVLIQGRDTRDEKQRRAIRETVGMIFQNPDNQLIATIVEDDIAWALKVRGTPVESIRERVQAAMASVGITELREMPPSHLSGGQRQRVAIAGVLALRPLCIIADEATSMLDPLSRREITRLLHQLHTEYGLTIIQVTHLIEEAMLAGRVVVMEQGKIVEDGSPEEILSDIQRLRSLGLAIPEPLQLAALLRDAGVPVSPTALSIESLVEELV